MNVVLGLRHSYSGKVVTFQESVFACKRKLSKTSRLLHQAATGQLPRSSGLGDRSSDDCDHNKILPVSVTRDRSRQTSGHPAQTIGAVGQ